MINVGVIGYGYWGPNIVRNLHGLDSTRVEAVCDKSEEALAKVRKAFPGVKTCTDPEEILTSPTIDAVAVITPVWTHYELAKRALENGKHVFVEKPFTSSSAQAEELIELAEQKASDDHGGSHVPVHRSGAQDSRIDRERSAGRPVLLRFAAH